MASEWFALAAALLVAGAILGAYVLGRGNRLPQLGQGFHLFRQYKPTIVVEIQYRNETGIQSARRVAIYRSLRHDDGRLFLFGFTGRREPRTYRADRIISVATPDGEVLDTRQFLTNWLEIPAKLIATGKV